MQGTLKLRIDGPVLLDCGNCGEDIDEHTADTLRGCADTPWDDWDGPITKVKGVRMGVIPCCVNCGERLGEHTLEDLQECMNSIQGATQELLIA
ncbi:hypothetical protein [Polyangium mundeleinium]|uniref:YgiT-type zinc finger protein n=1 Tax=Polyangium mundeleinium TaxID=2995306 RepID=A0ABT5EXX1_9BACT|nr:hypothetical protein [Polyangium mundeleinium]MDC0746675.1 hypothetical protein [Polyangium mundeleinium]